MAKMKIRSADLTTCESLRMSMQALTAAIGDAAHAGDGHGLYELTSVWLKMRRMLLARERRISREIDKLDFDSASE